MGALPCGADGGAIGGAIGGATGGGAEGRSVAGSADVRRETRRAGAAAPSGFGAEACALGAVPSSGCTLRGRPRGRFTGAASPPDSLAAAGAAAAAEARGRLGVSRYGLSSPDDSGSGRVRGRPRRAGGFGSVMRLLEWKGRSRPIGRSQAPEQPSDRLIGMADRGRNTGARRRARRARGAGNAGCYEDGRNAHRHQVGRARRAQPVPQGGNANHACPATRRRCRQKPCLFSPECTARSFEYHPPVPFAQPQKPLAYRDDCPALRSAESPCRCRRRV